MRKLLALATLGAMLAACSSVPLNIQTVKQNEMEGKDYRVIGEGEGSSVGIMLFNCIPINQNDRFQNAYNEAVQSRQGDRMINTTIEERWFWAYLLNGYVFKVKGTVVKDLKTKTAEVVK